MRARMVGLAFLMAACSFPASGTTVHPATFRCPACEKQFVANVVGSTFFCGRAARDLTDFHLFACNGLTCCPHCLYTAFQSDFDDLPADERTRIRQALASLPNRLADRTLLGPASILGPELTEDTVILPIAGVCYAARKPDVERDVHLLRFAYYDTKHKPTSSGHVTYRERLITALSEAIARGAWKEDENALYTYLLGELQRLAGKPDAALASFARAKQLAAGLKDREKADWVVEWSDEQTYRTHAASKTAAELEPDLEADLSGRERVDEIPWRVEVAMETLASRTDPEAWGVLLRFCRKAPENLECLNDLARLTPEKLKRHPPMWEWLKAKYMSVSSRRNGGGDPDNWRWLWVAHDFRDVFEPDKSHDAFASDEELADKATYLNALMEKPDSGVAPSGWDEEVTLRVAAVLIRRGEPKATRWFVAWAARAEERVASGYPLSECMRALACSPKLWPLVLSLTADRGGAQRPRLLDCIRFVCGDESTAETLRQRVRTASQWRDETDLIITCFQAKGHPGLKKAVTDRLAAERQAYVCWAGYSYVGAVGDSSDVPRLEEIARQKAEFDEELINSAIRTIRLRSVLDRVRPTGSPANRDASSQPAPFSK